MKLPTALRGTRDVVLDTMLFVYLFEDTPPYGALCEFLLRQAAEGTFSGMVTPVTAGEIIVKPLRVGRPNLADRYREAILNVANIRPARITHETGFLAGALRAKYNLPFPDMLRAAVAIEQGSGTLISNDKALKRVRELRIFLLDDML